jgi:hypothetical protein
MPPVPNPQGGGDPTGAVRVQLSLLSAQDTAAAQQLAASLKEIGKMFEALKASDFRETAQRYSALNNEMRQNMDRLRQQNESMQTRRNPSMSDLANRLENAGGTNVSEANNALQLAADKNRDQADQERRDYQQSERERIQGLSSEEHSADRRRRAAGYPGIGAPGDGPAVPGGKQPWFNRVDPLIGGTTGIDIPRFGQLTMQDYLNMARDRRMREALEANRGGNTGEADRLGGQAAFLQSASNRAGEAYAGMAGLRVINARMANQGIGIGQMMAGGAGTPMGFRREGDNIFANAGEALGINTPFTEAGREGFERAQARIRMRMSAGINNEQASAIDQASASAGFSGDIQRQVSTNLMAPLFRQFGVDPQQIEPLTRGVRLGTEGVQDLNQALSNMGEEARAARMDVNSYAQALNQSADMAAQAGGTMRRGREFGQQFATTFGMSPTVGAEAMNNRFVQANLAATSGVAPLMQGALPAGMKNQAIQTSVRSLVGAFRGATPIGGVSSTITNSRGQRITQTTGQDELAIGAAATQLGMSPDEVSRILHGGDDATNRSEAYSAAAAFAESGKGDPRVNTRHANKTLGPNQRVQGGRVQRHIFLPHGGSRWEDDDHATRKYEEAMQGGRGSINSDEWSKVVGFAKDAGLTDAQIKTASKGKTAAQRAGAIEKALDEKSREDQAKYEIAFTGPAAAFFKALVKNAGGKEAGALQRNFAAASSKGPGTISGTQAAAGGLTP